jgi:hypothetical protein
MKMLVISLLLCFTFSLTIGQISPDLLERKLEEHYELYKHFHRNPEGYP